MKTLAYIVLGFVIACAFGAVRGFASRAGNKVDRTPTEVLVAAQDVPEGSVVAKTRTLTLPANWVTESMIRESDWARVSTRALSSPVVEGDVLTWQLFAPTDRFEATKACVLAIHSGLEDAVAERIATELRELQPAELELTPPPDSPRGGTVRVLVASVDLKAGTTIGPASLRAVDFPVAFQSESLIPESESEAVIGATTVAELQAGDVVWWQHLQRREVLGPNTCVAKLEAVREEYAAKNAAAFELRGATP